MTAHPALSVMEALLARRQSLYLGRSNGVRFATAEEHLLALGPPRSGKTTGLIIPSAAVHPGPVVVVSTRHDVLPVIKGSREAIASTYGGVVAELTLGEVSSAATSVAWSILQGCEDWTVALDRADILAATAVPVDKDSFWKESAVRLLAGSLHAAALAGDSEQVMTRRLETADAKTYYSFLYHNCGEGHPATVALSGFVNDQAMADDTRKSVFATVSAQVLGAFRYTQLQANTDLKCDDFMATYGTIFVTIPWHRAMVLRPIVCAFVEALIAAWRKHRPQTGTLLLALDEVANVARLPNLPKIISAGGGDGIQLLLGMQEPSQASRWGTEAQGILNGTNHAAVFPGLKDATYLESLSRLIGSQVQYEREVHVVDGVPMGHRVADQPRLLAERSAIEGAVDGLVGPEARYSKLRCAAGLAVQRLRLGVRCRDDEPVTARAVLNEIEKYTTVSFVPKRLATAEVYELSAGRYEHFYLRGPKYSGFRHYKRWFEDALWREILSVPTATEGAAHD